MSQMKILVIFYDSFLNNFYLLYYIKNTNNTNSDILFWSEKSFEHEMIGIKRNYIVQIFFALKDFYSAPTKM